MTLGSLSKWFVPLENGAVDPVQTFRYSRFCVWIPSMFLYRITVGRITLSVPPCLLAVVLLCELCVKFETRGCQTGRIRPLSKAAGPLARRATCDLGRLDDRDTLLLWIK